MNELHFTETFGFVTVELCEDDKNVTVGWISRPPKSRAVFQQAMDVDEISFDDMASIYAKMVDIEMRGISSDHESEIERLESELAKAKSNYDTILSACFEFETVNPETGDLGMSVLDMVHELERTRKELAKTKAQLAAFEDWSGYSKGIMSGKWNLGEKWL